MAENVIKVAGKLQMQIEGGKNITLVRSPNGIWIKMKSDIVDYVMQNYRKPASMGKYLPVHDEIIIGKICQKKNIPLMLKGPTSTGKTHFVEKLADELNVPIITVPCSEDTSIAHLQGTPAPLSNGGMEIQFIAGALVLGGITGALVYLDEVYEVPNDVLVSIHPIADDRRLFEIRDTGQCFTADPNFMLTGSYNPGKKYQDPSKALKPSTALRFVSIYIDHPKGEFANAISAIKFGVKYVYDASNNIYRPIEDVENEIMNKAKAKEKEADERKIALAKDDEATHKLKARISYLVEKIVEEIRGGIADHERGMPGTFLEEACLRIKNFALSLIYEGIPPVRAIEVALANTLSDEKSKQEAIVQKARDVGSAKEWGVEPDWKS
ncbi:MAG: AAA family ATPase [Candidatus Micrarchaeota archaeon]